MRRQSPAPPTGGIRRQSPGPPGGVGGKQKEKTMVERIRAFQRSVLANKRCADCVELGPTYVCLDFQTFVCQACSGIHREFGHKIKGISLSDWATSEVELIERGGNERAIKKWLGKWKASECPEPDGSDQEAVRSFIRKKYVEKKWYVQQPVESPSSKNGSTKGTTAAAGTTGESNNATRAEKVEVTEQKPPAPKPAQTNQISDLLSGGGDVSTSASTRTVVSPPKASTPAVAVSQPLLDLDLTGSSPSSASAAPPPIQNTAAVPAARGSTASSWTADFGGLSLTSQNSAAPVTSASDSLMGLDFAVCSDAPPPEASNSLLDTSPFSVPAVPSRCPVPASTTPATATASSPAFALTSAPPTAQSRNSDKNAWVQTTCGRWSRNSPPRSDADPGPGTAQGGSQGSSTGSTSQASQGSKAAAKADPPTEGTMGDRLRDAVLSGSNDEVMRLFEQCSRPVAPPGPSAAMNRFAALGELGADIDSGTQPASSVQSKGSGIPSMSAMSTMSSISSMTSIPSAPSAPSAPPRVASANVLGAPTPAAPSMASAATLLSNQQPQLASPSQANASNPCAVHFYIGDDEYSPRTSPASLSVSGSGKPGGQELLSLISLSSTSPPAAVAAPPSAAAPTPAQAFPHAQVLLPAAGGTSANTVPAMLTPQQLQQLSPQELVQMQQMIVQTLQVRAHAASLATNNLPRAPVPAIAAEEALAAPRQFDDLMAAFHEKNPILGSQLMVLSQP